MMNQNIIKNIALIIIILRLLLLPYSEVLAQNTIKINNTADDQPYMYRPANGGIEIDNGDGRFNRPLYTSVERPHRIVALAGDRPDFMMMELLGKGSLFKLANLKLGFAGESWLSEITPIITRYEMGVQKYKISEGEKAVSLEAVRALDFDGLLLRMRRSGADNTPLVFAIGGRSSGSDYGAQGSSLEDESSAASLKPEDCQETTLKFSNNVLTLSGKGNKKRIPIHATSSVPLKFKAGDPDMISRGPEVLLASQSDTASVGVLTADWTQNGELFFILTADDPNSAGVSGFLSEPRKVFAKAVEDNMAVANTIQIETPNPYLNAIMPVALLSYNASWNDPVFCHGAVSWHSQYAGWRNTYGGTTAGWYDRVQMHMNAFFKKQDADGRIPSMLENDEIYNMGEVLVDQALYDWEWTGDLEPLRNGGFDAIAKHLSWGEKNMKTPEGLYENFLNAWNTDYKWCNGGGGTIASVYYWRANKTMVDIAKRLGKDSSVFQKRETEIANSMKKHLWSESTGVYGEYRDRFGHKLLHDSPALSSIYTPIYLGFCDIFESYRMLNFALRRFEVIDGLPRSGKLIYSSEWLPNHYSTRGLYTQEIIDALFAMYLTGSSEVAEPFRRGIDGSFFSGPEPGSTGLALKPISNYRPRIEEFYFVEQSGFGITEGTRTVKANGQTWWEGHGNDLTGSIDTYKLKEANGRFVTDNGIPFHIPTRGKDAVFTSLYDNFPDSVTIPVKVNGRKVCFLISASISLAQSRMENARITVVLGDGKRQTLSLKDPENIDDWMGSGTGIPYTQSGRIQSLGKNTHAVLQEIDLGEEKNIQSVVLETRTCETMVGLLGVTIIQ